MLEQDRVKLLFGPYRMPKRKVGQWLPCRMRGKARIMGISDAPMQWPYTYRHEMDRRPSLIVCGDLVRALQRESATAIAHWWGASISTVWRWRTLLGVEPFTEGTRVLYGRCMKEKIDEAWIANLKEALKSPERQARMGAANRGKPMPAHVKETLIKANKGRRPSAATRRRMSEAQKNRVSKAQGFGVPWTAEEEAILGTMSDREVAEKIGRSRAAVVHRRIKRRIPTLFVNRKQPCKCPAWTPKQRSLLGTMPDSAVARKLGCTVGSVFARRKKLGIPSFWRSE
jgi:hypothetical protein